MTEKLYGTIKADPPWDVHQKGKYGAQRHYPLMTLEQIKAMPIADLAAPNAHCYLWVTNATLRHGYDVLEAWGFKPSSPITWCKPRLGLGHPLRNCTEHLLLGTRGKSVANFKSQPTWMFAPVHSQHSRKPEEAYDVAERVSPGPYLELFARRHRHGWDAWGDEIDSDIDIPGYPVPNSPATRRAS